MSFVVVRFSNEYEHNFLASPCTTRVDNQIVAIENIGGLHYPCLGAALNTGLDQAIHEVIAFVHEDVYLELEWQAKVNAVLNALETSDPQWGVLGAAGLDRTGRLVGNFFDPHGSINSFSGNDLYARVQTLDEQLMIVRKSSGLRFDASIPGIHGLGSDLLFNASDKGLNCYVVNAPTRHKYKTGDGLLVTCADDSSKISHRTSFTYLADKECCDDYISNKWRDQTPFSSTSTRYEPFRQPHELLASIPDDTQQLLDAPIILLCKGGGGSRLLASLAEDAGVCLGHSVNISGDCLDLVMAVYKSVIEKYKCPARWQQDLIVPQLRLAAAQMLQRLTARQRGLWGFKLPETLFLLPEIAEAFPRARFLQMFRNPFASALRRTHMTARLDNEIGRLTLPLAYRAASEPLGAILGDATVLHMAYTTAHQLRLGLDFSQTLSSKRYFECRFEALLNDPDQEVRRLSTWLGTPAVSMKVSDSIDQNRADHFTPIESSDLTARIAAILEPLSQELGYSKSTPF